MCYSVGVELQAHIPSQNLKKSVLGFFLHIFAQDNDNKPKLQYIFWLGRCRSL